MLHTNYLGVALKVFWQHEKKRHKKIPVLEHGVVMILALVG